jgi:hypothetical protein
MMVMVCRKCGLRIEEKDGEFPMMGYGFALDEKGDKLPDSEQTLGVFHAACWAEVKDSLGAEPTA